MDMFAVVSAFRITKDSGTSLATSYQPERPVRLSGRDPRPMI